MPDSSDIDNALVAKLLGDTTLMALIPGSAVYWDEGPPNMPRQIIVSLVNPSDRLMFGGRAFEANTYMVKAVMRSDVWTTIEAAAARIDELLEGGTLTVSGYTLMCLQRNPDLSRIRTTERDEPNPAVLWQHRGGYYDVVVSP